MPLQDLATVKKYKKVVDFENNTNISLKNRYVYFAVDKVANSSIKNSLFEIEYASVGKTAITLYDKRCSPLLSPYQLPIEMLRDVLNSGNYFRFAFVRNPYSRLLSCYLDRILTASSKPRRQINAFLKRQGQEFEQVTFEQFIKAICAQTSNQQNSHWRSQTDDILHGEVNFDFIGKFETLWPDMAVVSSRVWGELKPEMANKDVNKSPRATNAGEKLREYYSPELAALVSERFRGDFEAFGYESDITQY